MTAMPAVRLCSIIILGHVAIVQAAPLFRGGELYVGCASLLVALFVGARGDWTTSRAFACVALAFLLAGRLTSEYVPSQTDAFGGEYTARVEGDVRRVLSARSKAPRLLVVGEVDCIHLPGVRTGVLVTMFRDSTDDIPPSGSRVVIHARVRRPDPATLPHEFNEQAMCRSMNVSFVGTASVRDISMREKPSTFAQTIQVVQHSITNALQSHVAPHIAAVLRAVIIGDESELERDARRAYANSGTAHMFSVSGSHVAILLAIGLAITVSIRRRWLRAALLLLTIIGYVIVSGGSAPAWRAAIMGLLALWGRNTERDVLGLNILAMAVLCMIVIDPSLPWSAGFQLSVCATAAILFLTPKWNSLLKRCTLRDNATKRFIRVSCAVTLAATAGTSLPSAFLFDQVAVWSPLANLVVVPILSGAMVAGSGLVFVHYAAPWLAPSLAWVCTILVDGANGIALLFAELQPSGLSSMHVVCHAVLTVGITVWPLIAPSYVGIALRQVMCIALLIGVTLVPVPAPPVVQQFQRRMGIITIIRATRGTVVLARMQKRDVSLESYLARLEGNVRVIRK